MKTILVPTDFSECSVAAFDYAALIAKKIKAQIYLVHILDIPSAKTTSRGDITTDNNEDVLYMMALMKKTKIQMEKVKSSLVFKNADVKDSIETGSVPEKIFNAAKKYNADLIVMGTHGINGSKQNFIGTNAEKIVRDAEIPVLTVKHGVKNPKIETILIATDFSKEMDYVLPAVSNIADMFKAKLILTKVITLNDFQSTHEVEKEIKLFKEKSKLSNYSTTIYYDYSKEEGIRRVSNKMEADMIALGTHGRHGLSHLFNGSIAEEVVSRASLPVLTINFHKKSMNAKTKVIEKTARRYESDFLYQIPSV